MSDLGRLERVDLRTIWTSESGDFTPWLAQEENIRLLGDALGLFLEVQAQEKEVGPFRADILCKNIDDDSWVLIENQLERTDHTHLGQLLTYAAGLEAVTIVWIAQRFTEEHRAALDWLNEITAEHITFFGLEVELWRIGGSPVAPKFNIVSKPNDWSRTLQHAARNAESSEAKQLQLSFWLAFQDYLDQHSTLRCQKPAPRNRLNSSIGKQGMHLSCIASMYDSEAQIFQPELRVEMYLKGDHAKENYQVLLRHKEDLEKGIGEPLVWYDPENASCCRIYVRRSSDFTDEPNWPEQHAWLKEYLEKFHKVFSPWIRDLK